MTEDRSDRDLDDNGTDRLAAIVRGAVSAAPLVGGLLAELATALIPKQRHDRLTAFVRELANRLSNLESEFVQSALFKPENIELVEKGADAAVRALSPERIESLAALVANGISAEKIESVRNGRLIDLLNQVDDEEVLVLLQAAKFHLKNFNSAPRLNVPRHTAYAEGWEEAAPRVLFDHAEGHLVNLGLLEQELRIDSGTNFPRLQTGSRNFETSTRLSSLGLLLLRRMGYSSIIKD